MEILLLFAALVVVVALAIIRGIAAIKQNLFGPIEELGDELALRAYRFLCRRGLL